MVEVQSRMKRPASSRTVPLKLGVGRRASPRVPVAMACEVAWEAESRAGSLVDLSMGGAAIGLAERLPLDEAASVTLKLDLDARPVMISATLVEQSEETFGSFVARLKFEGHTASPAFQQLLSECFAAFRATQAAVFRRRL